MDLAKEKRFGDADCQERKHGELCIRSGRLFLLLL
jgi:hypothetical protein